MTAAIAPEGIAALEAAEAAADKAGTKDTARTLSQIIADGMKAGIPEKTETPEGVVGEEAKVEGEGAQTPETGAEEPVAEAISDEEMTQVEEALSAVGIDLGMKAADIPEDQREFYNRVIYSLVPVVEDALTKQIEASDNIRQAQEFKTKLEESPDRLLLALAMKNPKIIADAAALVAEMEADPRVKETVRRELEVELRLSEAERKEKMLEERGIRYKAQQVISATRRAAREANVPFELAEEFVALAIQANGGDLSPEEVPEIVSGLKKHAPKLAPRPKVVSPAKAQATKTAPSGAVAGQQGAASVPSQTKVDPSRERSGGVFRGLVKNAVARLSGNNS